MELAIDWRHNLCVRTYPALLAGIRIKKENGILRKYNRFFKNGRKIIY